MIRRSIESMYLTRKIYGILLDRTLLIKLQIPIIPFILTYRI